MKEVLNIVTVTFIIFIMCIVFNKIYNVCTVCTVCDVSDKTYDDDTYTLDDFKSIQPLHNKLQMNFITLQMEVKKLLHDKTHTKTEIYYGDVYSPEKKNILESLKNGNGWSVWGNERKDWFHYPITYDSKMLTHTKKTLPDLYEIIEPYKNNFHSIYISALKPHGSIDPHHDGDHVTETLGKKILTYHFYFDAPPTSIIGVNGKEYEQKTGEYFIFDNTKTHWVKNKSDKWRIGIVGKFYI